MAGRNKVITHEVESAGPVEMGQGAGKLLRR
jgi:hypothetical protein